MSIAGWAALLLIAYLATEAGQPLIAVVVLGVGALVALGGIGRGAPSGAGGPLSIGGPAEPVSNLLTGKGGYGPSGAGGVPGMFSGAYPAGKSRLDIRFRPDWPATTDYWDMGEALAGLITLPFRILERILRGDRIFK